MTSHFILNFINHRKFAIVRINAFDWPPQKLIGMLLDTVRDKILKEYDNILKSLVIKYLFVWKFHQSHRSSADGEWGL